MQDQTQRLTPAQWMTAAIAGAALLALLLVYFLALRPAEDKINGKLTDRERAAMLAASGEAVNAQSYRRASFEADWQRALSGATGAFAADLRRDKDAARKAMTDGKYDLSAKVTHVALEEQVDSGSHHGYVVLVTLNGFTSRQPTLPQPSQLAVTVEDVDGKWLVSDIQSIGVSA